MFLLEAARFLQGVFVPSLTTCLAWRYAFVTASALLLLATLDAETVPAGISPRLVPPKDFARYFR